MTINSVPSDTDRLAEIAARLDAASEKTTMDVHAGRSTLRASVSGGDRGRFIGGMGDLVAATVGETGPLTVTVADDEDGKDATLTLHARDDLEYLLKRVRLLEQAYEHAKQQRAKYERRVIGWREQCSLATRERDAALVNAKQLQGRLDTAEGQLAKWRDIHQPEKRYTPDDGETSYATHEEAADASFDGVGTPRWVTFFEVCSHCASIEMAEGCEHDYRESLWPCKDAKAAGLGEGDGQ